MNFIEENDVTLATLSCELERAVMQYETREKSLYVNESGMFPFWIHVNDNGDLVGLETYLGFRDTASELDQLKLSNEFNRYAFGITAYAAENKLKIDHIINFRGGLLRETFVRVCRNFALTVHNSIRDHDPNYEILLRLSEIPTNTTDEEKG